MYSVVESSFFTGNIKFVNFFFQLNTMFEFEILVFYVDQ